MKVRNGKEFSKPPRYEWTNDAKVALAERKRLNKLFAKKKYAKVFFTADKEIGRMLRHDFQHKHMHEWVLMVNSSSFNLTTTSKRYKVTKESKPSLPTKARKLTLFEQNTIILNSLGYKPRKTKNKLKNKNSGQTDNLNCKERRNNKTNGKYRKMRKAA